MSPARGGVGSGAAGGALTGGFGGLLGGLAGPWLVMAAHQLSADADSWLKGAHGPPFFDMTLFTATYYACLAAATGGGGWRRRLLRAAGSSAAAFLALSLVLGISTRAFSWGEGAMEAPTLAWFYLVLGSYIAANAAAVLVMAWETARRFSWRTFGPPLASLAVAYPLDRGLQLLLERFSMLGPRGGALLPSPGELGTAILWGGLIGTGLHFCRAKGDR